MGPNKDLGDYTDDLLYVLYEKILPKNSLGRLADNPFYFLQYFLDKDFDKTVIPNLVLAKDIDTNVLTWHYFCDRADTYDLIKKERYLEESIASGHRKRNLKFLEVYSSTEKKYFIIKEK